MTVTSLDAQMTGRPLTARQTQVLQHVAGGMSNRQIAKRLDAAERTVRNHLTVIFAKLDVGNRTAAVVAGLKAGIIE
jgi:DNA-binding NarL/FixJ family response regulator